MSRPETSKKRRPPLSHGGGRAGKRILQALPDVLDRVLAEGEAAVAVAEAVESIGWRQRAVLGFMWPLVHRVALVFTERRLIEITLSPTGRRATGQVREFAWTSALEPRTDGRFFSFGDEPTWRLRYPLPEILVAEIARRSKAVTTQARRVGQLSAWRLCPECGLTSSTKDVRCRRCGALRRTGRLASFLSLAFPGAGLLFVKRPGLAFFRFLFELGLLAVFVKLLLESSGSVSTWMTVIGGSVVLLLVKLESLVTVRAFAERAGTVEDKRVKRWRKFVPLGIVLSLAGVISPIFLAGAANRQISCDLYADAEHLGWTFKRFDDSEEERQGNALLRSRWQHSDGWVVDVAAQPFEPFEWTDRQRRSWMTRFQGRPEVGASELVVGSFEVIRSIETSVDERGNDLARVSYVVFDSDGRDEHVLTSEVAQDELPAFNARIQKLLRCMYWVAVNEPPLVTRILNSENEIS